MNKRHILLIIIFLIGFILRFWRVDLIPPGLNRDEASIGYSAYSILKTGKDEYGVSLPLSFKSFGDWKLPLYIYADILPIAFWDLNEFSTRLPSLLFGFLTVILVYFLCLELFKDFQNKRILSLLSSFFLAISPWHIHFSRVASEANLAVFLVTLSLLLFLKGLAKPVFLLFASTTLSLSLYTYHGNHIFTPLLFLGLIIIVIKNKIGTKSLLLFLLPFILLSTLIYQKTLRSADKTKISGLTPLSDISLVYENVDLARLDHIDFSSIPAKLFHNKLTFPAGKFIEGYGRSFSTEFLFIKGGGNFQHNIPKFGNLYFWDAPFIILGLFFLFLRSYKFRHLLLFWLLISPIPAAITKDAPHSARMLAILPLPQILAAIGFIELISNFNTLKRKTLKFTFIVLLMLNFAIYADKYFIHFPKTMEAFWGGGFKELVSTISSLSGNYKEVVIDKPDYSPYIYFLYYNKTDPFIFQKEAVRYSEDQEGFQHVRKFENLTFKKLDWGDDLIIPGRLLVTWVDTTPSSATESAVLVDGGIVNRISSQTVNPVQLVKGEDIIVRRIVKVIKMKNDQPQFYLIDVGKIMGTYTKSQ